MSLQSFFPTQLWTAQAPRSLVQRLNPILEREARTFQQIDDAGARWSRKNYHSGYTSYGSVSDLPHRSPTFARLKNWIDREALKFARTLELDLDGGRLEMTTCWVNIMGRHCTHAYHLHPLSTISGTYYLQVPQGAGALKIEDPRLPAFMGSPPRKTRARPENRRFHEFHPRPGQLILFESWLKHEVPPNQSDEDRVSVSFNYDWIR